MKKLLAISIILLLVMQSFCFAQTSSNPLPNVNAGVYYDEANQQFNAFMHITKNGYEKNATLYIAAYKNKVLLDLKTANLTDLEDTDSVYATVDYDSEADFKDYSFKYFMFDEDLKPLKQFPVFTVQDPPPSEEVQPSIKISGIIVENTTTAINSPKAIDTSIPAKVMVKLCDTYGTTHSAFREYSDWTASYLESSNITLGFLVGDSSAESYLGKRVDLYLEEDKTSSNLVITDIVEASSNIVASFSLDQYEAISTSGGRTYVEYYKNASDRDATALTLDANTTVVYNNVGGYTTDEIFGPIVMRYSPYGGQITLIDNNSTNGYDVILVEMGATAVVDEVVGTRVYFRETAELANGNTISSILVNAEATDKKYVFYKNGKEISVSDLQEWDVLTIVAADNDSDYITAEVITTTVSGSVSAVSSSVTSATGLKYTINGAEYDVAHGNYKAGRLQYGDAGTFYIDKYGKIAAYNEDDSVIPGNTGGYGYVLYSAYETSALQDSVYRIRLLTDSGVETLKVASIVSYCYAGDNTKYTLDSSRAFKNTTDGSGTIKGSSVEFNARNQFELIKYRTNSAGEINAIYEAGYDYDKFAYVADVAGAYDAANLKLGKALDEDTKVIFLATSTTGATPVNDINGFVKNDVINVGGTNYKINTSSCAIGTLSDLIDDEYYTGKVYIDSKGELGNLLVVTTGYGKVAAASSIAVITKVSAALTQDYKDCQILSYYMDGELKEGVYTTSDAMDTDLSEGDIVKLFVSSSGVIAAIDILVDFGYSIRNANGTIDGVFQKIANGKDKYFFGYGDAYTKSTKALTIGANTFRLSSAQNVYVVNASLRVGKVNVGTAGDFEWDREVITNADKAKYADYVFIREYDGKVEDVVIIENIIDYQDPENGIVLGTLSDLADEYYAAYKAAKAAYEAYPEDYDLKQDVIDAANTFYYAAIEAYSYDSSYDISIAEAAKAYADTL